MTLSELRPGEAAVITGYTNQNSHNFRLHELGILEGEKVEVLKKAPLGDPLEIRVMNYHLCLRTAEADHVEVRKL